MRRWSLLIGVLILPGVHRAAIGQGKLQTKSLRPPANVGARESVRTLRLQVTPMAIADPPLQHRLLHDAATQQPGNAALCYYRAIVFFRDQNLSQHEQLLGSAMGDDAVPVPKAKADEIISSAASVFKELARGARRDRCEWELPLYEEGFATLLPEFQQSRSLARLLSFKAHLEIAAGNHAEAALTLKSLFGLSRGMAQAPLLIAGLIGVAEAMQGIERLEEWVVGPQAPNIYWSIAALPKPLIAGAESVATELEIVRKMFPEVFGFDESPKSPEQWQRMLNRTMARVNELDGLFGPMDSSRGTSLKSQTMGLALALKVYPAAKQQLIANGRKSRDVEAMPVAQVILMHTRDAFDRMAQRHLRWWSMPYAQAAAGFAAEDKELAAHRANFDEGVPIGSLLMPAFGAAMTAFARLERRVAALQIVEAIRDFSASKGRLPNTLAEMNRLPIPLDPITGVAFDYRIVDGKAVLDLTGGMPPSSHGMMRYEISLKPEP